MARSKRPRQTPTSSRLPSDPSTRWARDVVAGKVLAGDLVRKAAERHLKDLAEGHKRGLSWHPDEAQKAIDFFPAVLKITAGAKAGHPFVLLPWMKFCVGSLFGWKTKSGRLRFRHAWFETGKGQAKSPLMAAIGLYCVGFRGVKRAEGYAIAWDKDQANVPFKDAVAMCRADIPGQEEGDTLESRGAVVIRGTLDNAWKIEFPATNSKFQSLANGENISGPRPCFILADEVHEYKGNSLIETWRRAIAKMPGDALMVLGTNTPGTTQIVGTEYSEFYQKIVKGENEDDEAFAFIARVDKGDDPFKDERCWVKALPSLNVTFPVENIRGEVNTARILLSTAMSVKRLYFGIPIGTVGFWIAEEAWVAVQGEVDPLALKGRPCWLSLDLSDKNDLTALSAAWVGADGHISVKTWYWTAEDGLPDRARQDNAPYVSWKEQGFITAVPGPVIEKRFVAQQVAKLCAENSVQFLAFDVAGIDDFMVACKEIGFPVWRWQGDDKPPGRGLKLVSHAQGTRIVFEDKQMCMPRSIERLEDRVLTKTITIEDSPVTYMCASNAKVDTDAQKNRAFDKTRSRGRIDGLVTIAMVTGAATYAPKKREPEYQMIFVGG